MTHTCKMAEIEREYDNRALVPEHPAFFSRWTRDSEFVRATLPCSLDLPYGPDPRHRADVFPAANARGTLLFIHGGYWRSLDKSMFSWLAPAYVAAGLNVVMANYRLCPAVKIGDIVDDMVAAANWLMASPSPVGDGRGEGRVVLSGHSAGGHLAAALLATPLERLDFDPARIAGAVCLSGLYEFEPLRRHPFNADFRIEPDEVAGLDLHDKRPTVGAPLVAAVGGDESPEFLRHSQLIAERWAPQVRALHVLPGVHHFSIVDAFAERGQVLHRETLAMLGEAR